MAMPSFGLMFLMSMLMGGVGDLLDVIPSDEYWRIKNVQVTGDAIRQELAAAPIADDASKLIDALGGDDPAAREAAARQIRARGPGVVPQLQAATKSDNPEVAASARRLIGEIQAGGKAEQVRRLMAIRTAGEQKMAGLLPRLKELAGSDEPFVADYAAAAVAAVEGKPYARPRPANLADDVWRLPADCRAVLHVATTGGKVATAADLATVLQGMPGPADAEQKKQAVDQLMRQLVGVADQIGNVRVDGVTVGVAGDVGPRTGYVAFVVRGRYDAAAVTAMLGRMGAGQGRAVNGVDAIEFGKISAALFPSDTHAVLVAGPAEAAKPVDALAASFRGGGGGGGPAPLKGAAEMAKLLATIDTTQPVWGAVHMTPNYRQAPPLAALESLTLVGRAKDQGVSFRVDAKGENGEGIGRTVGMVNQGVGQARADLKRNAEQAPPQYKPMVTTLLKLMESVEAQRDPQDPTRATATGELDAPPLSIMGAFLGSLSFRAAEPVPMPVPAPIPQP